MTFSGDWAPTQLLDCCLLTYFKICKVFHNSTILYSNLTLSLPVYISALAKINPQAVCLHV